MFDLTGMTALVTGASGGIGSAICQALAAQGARLAVSGSNVDKLEAFRASLGGDHVAVPCDLGDKDSVEALVPAALEKLGQIDILVNNAGYGLSGPFTKYSAEAHIEMMRVNMEVPVALTAALLPMLTKNAPAYILNVASSAAYQAVPGLTAYAASKSFVLSFSRGLRHELKNSRVSVTAVSPGSTDTNFANRADVGVKALKTAEKVNMTPEAVAAIAVTALFNKKPEVITGFVNQLGAFLVWLLPKKLAESIAASLYGL